MLSGTALVSFQAGLLRVALPVIRADLRASIGAIEVVGLAGLVVTAATVVAFGRLADLLGARRVYSLGLVVFAVGGALSALAPTVGLLATAQAAQGLGWSMAVSSATPLLVGTFPPERRGRAVAASHMAIAIGLATGPAAGGLLVERLGWRVALFAVVPAALAVGSLSHRRLPGDAGSGLRPRFDLAGSVALAVALGTLLVVLDGIGRGGLSTAALVGIPVVAVAAFVVFVVVEIHAPEPTVDLNLFRNRGFSAGLAASLFNFVAMASNMFLMPFFLQEALGQSASRAGGVMMVMPAGVLVAAPLAGAMADRLGPRLPATVGMGLITAAIALMARFTSGVSLTEVAAVLTLYGVGAGLFQSPNISGVLGCAAADRLGVASGTLSTLGRLGQVVGVAIAGGLWQRATATTPSEAGQAAAFHDAFVVLAMFGAFATVASWLRGPIPHDGAARAAPRDSGQPA
ncbi:MAG: MFS transporter [Actinobacteria bacterium]|nr:MFS transporter [Actinomycetota bacterium]